MEGTSHALLTEIYDSVREEMFSTPSHHPLTDQQWRGPRGGAEGASEEEQVVPGGRQDGRRA